MSPRGLECGRAGPVTSLILPTYNAGAFLDRTWAEVRQFLRQAPGNWDVLFVCDGCTDDTPHRLYELARTGPDAVRILSYWPNRGKGFAVRHGLAEARGAWRIFTDVDLGFGLDGVLRAAELLWGGAEVVTGSRLHPDSRLLMPVWLQGYAFRRRLQSVVFAALVRLLLGLPQRDTQAGLKGFSAAAVRQLLPHLNCDRFAFDCELLVACERLGLAVSEVPVCFRYLDRESTTGPAAMGRMVCDLWHIRRAWRGKSPAVEVQSPESPRREAA